MIYARPIGTGSYLPKKILTNDDISQIVDTSDEWIQSRTGISQRHIAAESEYTSDLAAAASIHAIKNANILPEDIDIILLATATPDRTFPSCATEVQHKIGCINAAAMDINAACSGFIYGLHLANALIKSEQAKTILVIGAETMSRVVDWEDRGTCILFGDGAGAMVLQAVDDNSDSPSGILHSKIESDGRFNEILATNGGTSTTKTAGFLAMEGQEVFKHAVSKMSKSAQNALEYCSLDSKDVDWVIPHQANQRILTSCIKKLKLDDDKLISTVSLHANTSSASIPLAIDSAISSKKIKEKNILVLPALGAGLTWGTCIIRW